MSGSDAKTRRSSFDHVALSVASLYSDVAVADIAPARTECGCRQSTLTRLPLTMGSGSCVGISDEDSSCCHENNTQLMELKPCSFSTSHRVYDTHFEDEEVLAQEGVLLSSTLLRVITEQVLERDGRNLQLLQIIALSADGQVDMVLKSTRVDRKLQTRHQSYTQSARTSARNQPFPLNVCSACAYARIACRR